jgi:hypothetical protein
VNNPTSTTPKKPEVWVCQVCGGPPSGNITHPWIRIKSGGNYSELRSAFCVTCGQDQNFKKKEEQ